MLLVFGHLDGVAFVSHSQGSILKSEAAFSTGFERKRECVNHNIGACELAQL